MTDGLFYSCVIGFMRTCIHSILSRIALCFSLHKQTNILAIPVVCDECTPNGHRTTDGLHCGAMRSTRPTHELLDKPITKSVGPKRSPRNASSRSGIQQDVPQGSPRLRAMLSAADRAVDLYASRRKERMEVRSY